MLHIQTAVNLAPTPSPKHPQVAEVGLEVCTTNSLTRWKRKAFPPGVTVTQCSPSPGGTANKRRQNLDQVCSFAWLNLFLSFKTPPARFPIPNTTVTYACNPSHVIYIFKHKIAF